LHKQDGLKNLSAALSERLNAATGVQEAKQIFIETLTHFGGQLPPPPPPPGNRTQKDTAKEPEVSPIGIWEPKVEDGELWFVRPQEPDPRDLWADVERIGPKRDKLRVVLIGESVARGFLIDPYFNVATALQTLLNSSKSGPDVEVVDLARHGLMFELLERLLSSSLALKPDAYVIFAGNNWHVPQMQLLNFEKVATLLIQAGKWAPVKAYVEQFVRQQVQGFVERVGKLSAQHRIPVIFIIPDFNLTDWVLEDRQDPLFTSELIQRRLDLISRAEDALATNDLEQATVLADQLIELEDGSYAAGVEILAKCELSRGNFCKARQLKRTARDSILVYHTARLPICFSFTQEVLREHGPKHGITIVDLPHRFAEYSPEALTDRRFFFNHVHMTLEGIRLAAASAVEKLLPLLGKKERSWSELNQFEFDVEPRGLAMAHFSAARQYGVFGQGEELIRFHCSEALRHDPKIAEVMEAFLEWHIRQNRTPYVKKFEDVLGRKGHFLFKFPRDPFRGAADPLHPTLIRAMTRALIGTVPGIEDRVDHMLKQELGVTSAGIDLLRGVSTELTRAPLESLWQQESGYFRSFHQQSYFYVVCDLPRPLQLRLVSRILNAETATKPVEILVNGVSATNFQTSTNWHTWEGTIPAELLNSGINSIVLSWPMSRQTKTERVAEVLKSMESAIVWDDFKEIYTVYGEIHEFRATTASS
jgi:hypothetical protein